MRRGRGREEEEREGQERGRRGRGGGGEGEHRDHLSRANAKRGQRTKNPIRISFWGLRYKSEARMRFIRGWMICSQGNPNPNPNPRDPHPVCLPPPRPQWSRTPRPSPNALACLVVFCSPPSTRK